MSRIRSLSKSEISRHGTTRNPVSPTNTMGGGIPLRKQQGSALKNKPGAPTDPRKTGGPTIVGNKDTIRMAPAVTGKGRGSMPLRGLEKTGTK